jgi:hypothetical protein
MRNVIQKAIIAVCMAGFLTVLAPAAKAITQLELLQWMVQLTGDNAQFNAASTPADYTQWAMSKGMNPTGGWQPNSALSPEQLAQVLVQLYGLNPRKFGGDYFRILEREGISIDRRSAEVTRAALAGLVDEFGFQSRTAIIAAASTTEKGNNGINNDNGLPSPGWLNPRNPHFGQTPHQGPGNGNGGPGRGHRGN